MIRMQFAGSYHTAEVAANRMRMSEAFAAGYRLLDDAETGHILSSVGVEPQTEPKSSAVKSMKVRIRPPAASRAVTSVRLQPLGSALVDGRNIGSHNRKAKRGAEAQFI